MPGINKTRRKKSKAEFKIGDLVLVFDAIAFTSREKKFQPLWQGPFKLVRRISDSQWEYEELEEYTGSGRPAILIAHHDHLQHYSDKRSCVVDPC